ncbi:MAG: phage tail protein [Sphingobacteriales bacterium]
MNPSFVGAIYIFGGNFAMYGFSLCQGQLLSISSNDVLYTLIGTTFGGDGVNTFGLPDLRGRVALGQGTGPGLSTYVIGQASGTENATLTSSTMPSHTHLVNANSATGSASTPASNSYLAAAYSGSTAEDFYSAASGNATLAGTTIGHTGSSIPFSILQPVLAMNYVISLYGIFPSRN